ncbi:Dihydrofolate synthase [Chitinispirillum alkaliphilum]|nr:Dihydrofolate synthase [Chitinispirillum alkaliphilum]
MLSKTDSAEKISQRLFSRVNRGIKYELERMVRVAEECGNPQNFCRCFHVAGTNGKGSTCSFLESILRAQGFKTGLFTSPHILDFSERFRINGVSVEKQSWVEVYHDIEHLIEKYNLTFFEASTLIAFELFRRENVEWAVYETGMGGRLDATNIVRPEISIISKISMDHAEYLGSSLYDIAGEKLGIIQSKVPLVMALPERPDIINRAINCCEENECELTFVGAADVFDLASGGNKTCFTWKHQKFDIPCLGTFQAINAALALTAIEKSGVADPCSMKTGLRSAKIPGRFQVETIGEKTVVLDVAHNEDSIEVLASTVRAHFGDKRVLVVLGVMRDKKISEMVERIAECADALIFCEPDNPRSAKPEELSAAVGEYFIGEVSVSENVKDAVRTALISQYEVICIAGSFFTVGEAASELGVTV